MSSRRSRQAKLLAGIAVFYATLWLLWFTPVVFPLKIFVVLLHEVSHALAALATGGAVERIVLSANEGGATWTVGGNAFILLSAGYLGSLVWGLALIEVASSRPLWRRRALMLLGAVMMLVALLYVRNIFGFLFTLLFSIAIVVAARRLNDRAIGTVLLTLGLTSAFYALLDIRSDILSRPHLPSDAVMLARHTGVPALFWGVLWTAVAVAACAWALRRWLRRA